MAEPLIIWGAGGHAKVVADIIRLGGDYSIVGFIEDSDAPRVGEQFCHAPILGDSLRLPELRRGGVQHIILAFGKCEARVRLAARVREHGFTLATAVHPRSVVASDVVLGEGTVVAAGAVINPGAIVGANVIVNTSASVDHDCLVHDGAHICPGTHLAGHVTIGRAAWVGIGSTVKDRVTIGDGAVIGAGSVVVKDIPANAVAYGVPARVVRSKYDG